MESFRDFVTVQRLEGTDQFLARNFGLQDATKGILFRSFPSVLQIVLNRYQYDVQRGVMIKVRQFASRHASFCA